MVGEVLVAAKVLGELVREFEESVAVGAGAKARARRANFGGAIQAGSGRVSRGGGGARGGSGQVEKRDVRGETSRVGKFALAKSAGEEFGVVGQGASDKALVVPNLPVEIRVVVIGMLGVRRNPRVVKEVLLSSSNGREGGITEGAEKG